MSNYDDQFESKYIRWYSAWKEKNKDLSDCSFAAYLAKELFGAEIEGTDHSTLGYQVAHALNWVKKALEQNNMNPGEIPNHLVKALREKGSILPAENATVDEKNHNAAKWNGTSQLIDKFNRLDSNLETHNVNEYQLTFFHLENDPGNRWSVSDSLIGLLYEPTKGFSVIVFTRNKGFVIKEKNVMLNSWNGLWLRYIGNSFNSVRRLSVTESNSLQLAGEFFKYMKKGE